MGALSPRVDYDGLLKEKEDIAPKRRRKQHTLIHWKAFSGNWNGIESELVKMSVNYRKFWKSSN